MSTIRVPYPADPDRRKKVFRRLSSLAGRFGAIEGTSESGTFRGSTPIGGFAGSYQSDEGAGEIAINIDKKPLLISTSRIESELRKFLGDDATAAT